MSKIIGISLIIGPLLLLLLFAGLWPAATVPESEAIGAITSNPTYTLFLMFLAGSSILMITGGSVLLSRQQAEKADLPNKQILLLGDISFVVTATMFLLQGSFILATINTVLADNAADAAILYLMSNHVGDILPWTFGISMVLLAISGIHGSLKPRVSGLLIVPGFVFLASIFIGGSGIGGFIPWIVMTIVYVIVGISVLLKK